MKLGLLVFGQFRAWEDVLQHNINIIKNEFDKCDIDVFILTDKGKNSMYSKIAENTIINMFKNANFTIKLFSFWEDLVHLHATDKIIEEYGKYFLKDKIPVNDRNIWFMNNWYRRYCLWKLVEENSNWNTYDFFMFIRLFDTTIKILKPIQPLLFTQTTKDTLLTSIDTIFIGSPSIIKKVFYIGSPVFKWTNFQWTEDFIREFASFDSCLANQKMTFCSESQIFYYIYHNFSKWINIRYDFNKSIVDERSYIDIRIIRHMSIPRKIIQIALGDSYVASLPLQLLEKNALEANSGFSYGLLLEKDCIEFLHEHFPQHLSLFHSLQRPQYKSDLIRYLWLYTYGGWYIDIDLLPLVPLRNLYDVTEQADTIVSFGANHTFEMANGFLASVPGQKLFLDLVEQMAAEPNPSDFGMNVKRMFKTCKEIFSIEPFQNRNGVFSLLEQQLQPGKYFICYGNQPVVVSNGNGYPPKA